MDVCNTNCCPVDGEYSSWSQWSECSLTCGSGIRRRTRSCDSPPPDCNGNQCEGSDNEVESCNTEPCEPYCEDGKVYNNCSNKCDLTCSTLSCSLVCHEPDTCTPGCTCPSGTVENEKNECVTIDKCLCPYEDQIFLPGQIYEKDKCVSGCMECLPKNCSKCELSEWTEWSNCTNECGGISKRFRSYYGINCDRNDTIEEIKKCEQCNCTINNVTYNDGEVFASLENKCEECKCIGGKVICLPKCNETEESCREKSDEQYIFTYIYPIGDNCCGTCIKIPRVNNTCQVIKLKPQFIQTGGCISEKMLPREVCSGSCPSYEKSYIRFPGLANNAKSCKCCSADKTFTQNVAMRCPDGRIQAEYIRLASCKCEICGAS
ncbi:SCO-spondin [Brachionus plicatilis]|uniref:SCO-spondin n=1 Tax=Brachionus plicatilis TaxID=10195 RepID=A0A3M7PJQ3_BRAPC|nr:SCO-spondin [Brachionus plicatilis]